jgi:hydrogenase nickel incorporation protein HypA/HybF
MCEGLLDLIEKRADGRRITSVRVRVGARHAVVDQVFDQAFALVANGTAVEDAAVDLVIVPVTVACRSCGGRSESLDTLATCAHCGGDDVDISGGEDLVLESVQFEAAGSTTAGCETARSKTAGCEAVGSKTVGCETAGCEAAGFEDGAKGEPDVSRHSG